MAVPGYQSTFKIDNAADVITEVATGKGSEIGFTLDTAREDDTRFGDSWSSEDVILKNASGSLALRWDNATVKMFYDIYGLKKDFEFFPTGTGTGALKHAGKLLVATLDAPSSVSSQKMLNVTLAPAGAVTTTAA